MENIKEANRYLENAKEILRENAKKVDGYYQDKKYVKMAGHTAYTGILEALDGLLGIKKMGRKTVDWYQSALGKMDKKILNRFNSAYYTLHLAMGYDGHPSSKIALEGFKEAETIINWVAQKHMLKQ